MVISHVLLLITDFKLFWQGLLLGWVTFREIGVVCFFVVVFFRFYSCTLRLQCDAEIAKQGSWLISHS